VSERKTTEIKLRVSPEEKTSWQLAAEQREVGLSQFIRDCVEESIQAPDPGAWHYEIPVTVSKLVPPGYAVLTNVTDALDAEVEDSSVAQAVPTSGEANLVAKPWMFEARSVD
jgi:hypothetical protein